MVSNRASLDLDPSIWSYQPAWIDAATRAQGDLVNICYETRPSDFDQLRSFLLLAAISRQIIVSEEARKTHRVLPSISAT
jgi:hypothetical protein